MAKKTAVTDVTLEDLVVEHLNAADKNSEINTLLSFDIVWYCKRNETLDLI